MFSFLISACCEIYTILHVLTLLPFIVKIVTPRVVYAVILFCFNTLFPLAFIYFQTFNDKLFIMEITLQQSAD